MLTKAIANAPFLFWVGPTASRACFLVFVVYSRFYFPKEKEGICLQHDVMLTSMIQEHGAWPAFGAVPLLLTHAREGDAGPAQCAWPELAVPWHPSGCGQPSTAAAAWVCAGQSYAAAGPNSHTDSCPRGSRPCLRPVRVTFVDENLSPSDSNSTSTRLRTEEERCGGARTKFMFDDIF